MGIWEFNIPDTNPAVTPYDDEIDAGEKLQAECEALLLRVSEYINSVTSDEKLLMTFEDADAFLMESITDALGIVKKRADNYIEENY